MAKRTNELVTCRICFRELAWNEAFLVTRTTGGKYGIYGARVSQKTAYCREHAEVELVNKNKTIDLFDFSHPFEERKDYRSE